MLSDFHFHDLRHEAVSRFFEIGLTAPEVASISGHRDPRMLFHHAHPMRFNLIADKSYDSDELREALAAMNIEACIQPHRNRKIQHSFDKQLYNTRQKRENMFGRLKGWRRISIRHDRCAHTFFPAICITASFIFHFNQ